MLMRHIHRAASVFVLAISIFLAGCWSSEKATQNENTKQQAQQKKSIPTKQAGTKTTKPVLRTQSQKPPHGFSVNADTIEVESEKKTTVKHKSAIKQTELKQYYTIQIGGFKDQTNALRAEQLLKKRYTQSTNNYFDTNLKLNRVFIGVFQTTAEAQRFLNSMKRDFPSDYKNAFVWKVER